MGKGLLLKGVDFSDIAVDQVEILTPVEPVPCTGISLNPTSLSFDSVEESKQIVAILTPADTTDSLIWTSSNPSVASVENGTVTIHGIGTAIITATCGSQSATVSISQSSIKAQYAYAKVTGKTCGSTASGIDDKKILVISTLSSQSIGGQAYTNTDDLRIRGSESNNIECIRVPYGATKVKVDMESGSISYIEVVDTTSILTVSDLNYPEYIKNQSFPFSSGYYAVEYGQAFAFRGPTAGIEAVNYVYFE